MEAPRYHTLAKRLQAERLRAMVGRRKEQALFQRLLRDADGSFHLVYIHGPGGVGKTTLLAAYARLCEAEGIPFITLDGSAFAPTPEGFLHALRRAMGLGPQESPTLRLAALTERQVLMVDNYELLRGLDEWLREVFLPELPDHMVVVLADRVAPSTAWRTDAGWRSLFCDLPLSNLDTADALDYLQQCRVPEHQRSSILEFTHGHPLALSLVADLFAHHPNFHFRPEGVPDVVAALVKRLIREVPDGAHREALEACAMVRVMSEPLLAEMLGTADAHDLFEWLRSLAVVHSTERGLQVHDMTREALSVDLRWRNPERYEELRRRARAYYALQVESTRGQAREWLLADYFFLHRDQLPPEAQVSPEAGEEESVTSEPVRVDDVPAVLELVRQHEGEHSAALSTDWLSQQLDGLRLFRNAQGEIVGFLGIFNLNSMVAGAEQSDPGVRAAAEYVRRQNLVSPDETVLFVRFWLVRKGYERAASLQRRMFVAMLQRFLETPHLAVTLLAYTNPDFWTPVFGVHSVGVRVQEADFRVGDRRYGMFCRDWRPLPPMSWLQLITEGRRLAALSEAPGAPGHTLSQADFTRAVREALRHWYNPIELGKSPLLHARVVEERAGAGADTAVRIHALQALMKEAAESLKLSPRRAKLYRALHYTYFEPAESQEQAAEHLGVPFSTFRGHLKTALSIVTEILWQAEVNKNQT